jgi:hypothetical protein
MGLFNNLINKIKQDRQQATIQRDQIRYNQLEQNRIALSPKEQQEMIRLKNKYAQQNG